LAAIWYWRFPRIAERTGFVVMVDMKTGDSDIGHGMSVVFPCSRKRSDGVTLGLACIVVKIGIL